MVAFEVLVNGRVITTAGGEDVKALLAIIRWCCDEDGEEADIDICGQRGAFALEWKQVPLKVGDEVILRIIDAGINDMSCPKESLISDAPPAQEG